MKTNTLYTLLIGVTLSMYSSIVNAQNVAINASGAQPDPSAILDLTADDAGLLIPRMTSSAKISITSPAVGLMIYQTDGTKGFYYYDGTNWNIIGDSNWTLNGTNLYPNSNCNVGIGTTNPDYTLEVIGTNTNDLTIAIMGENVPSASVSGVSSGVYGKVPSGSGYTIGVKGTSTNSTSSLAGRSYGLYGVSSNAAAGYNYGVFGQITGDNAGTAILGWDQVNNPGWLHNTGSDNYWAGYFVGDVKVTDSLVTDKLVVEGSVSANTGWHGSKTIKILPNDFFNNESASYSAATNGMKLTTQYAWLYATIAIPEGHSANKIRINSDDNEIFYVFEVDMTTGSSVIVGAAYTNTDYTLNIPIESNPNTYIRIGVWNLVNPAPITVFSGVITLSN